MRTEKDIEMEKRVHLFVNHLEFASYTNPVFLNGCELINILEAVENNDGQQKSLWL